MCLGGTGLIQRCLSDPGSEGSTRPMSADVCHIGQYSSIQAIPYNTLIFFRFPLK